jgi:hypothetical protein
VEIVGLIYICTSVFSCELWATQEWVYRPDKDQMIDCQQWIENVLADAEHKPDEFFSVKCKYWEK